MKQFNIKEVFNEYGWKTGFKFHIKWNNSGGARVYVNDRPTKYKAGGYGYDKESSCIASMVNDLIGDQPYNSEIYGNSGNYNKDKSLHHLSGGVGFDSIQDSFQSLEGAKLTKLYWGDCFNVYEITFPTQM